MYTVYYWIKEVGWSLREQLESLTGYGRVHMYPYLSTVPITPTHLHAIYTSRYILLSPGEEIPV